jgi:hypothetical protein
LCGHSICRKIDALHPPQISELRLKPLWLNQRAADFHVLKTHIVGEFDGSRVGRAFDGDVLEENIRDVFLLQSFDGNARTHFAEREIFKMQITIQRRVRMIRCAVKPRFNSERRTR